MKFLGFSFSLILINASVSLSLQSLCFLCIQLSVLFHFHLLLRGSAQLFLTDPRINDLLNACIYVKTMIHVYDVFKLIDFLH